MELALLELVWEPGVPYEVKYITVRYSRHYNVGKEKEKEKENEKE